MARDRDVAAFGERAQGYDKGWRGRMHHQIADRTADLALTCVPAPRRILDVGCGTGYLLGPEGDASQAGFVRQDDGACCTTSLPGPGQIHRRGLVTM